MQSATAGALLVLTLAGVSGPIAGQSSDAALREELGNVAMANRALTAREAGVVLQALLHPADDLQRDALGVFEARLSPLTIPYRSAAIYQSDATLLAGAEPRVLAMLNTPSPQVRRLAVRAAVFLRISQAPDPARSMKDGFDPGPSLTERLAVMFDKEPDAGVRGMIVQLMSGISINAGEATARLVSGVLTKALNDSSWGVVSVAIRDAARRRIPGALTESVRLLQHKDFQVRMVAAQALASFGSEARPHLPALRRAAEVETDDITRKTMLGSITVIER